MNRTRTVDPSHLGSCITRKGSGWNGKMEIFNFVSREWGVHILKSFRAVLIKLKVLVSFIFYFYFDPHHSRLKLNIDSM